MREQLSNSGTSISQRSLRWRVGWPYRRLLVAGLLLVAAAGCSVQFVSLYDQATEQQITALQKKTEALLEELSRNAGKPEGAHDNYVARYAELRVDAAVLHTRTQALPLNDLTVAQAEELIGWLQNLERFHQMGISSPEVLIPLRAQAQSIYVAMLKLEIAKKRTVQKVKFQEE